MKKISEEYDSMLITKRYDFERNPSILEFIKELLNNSVQIQFIDIREGVERDMQSIDGYQYTPQEFIKNYDFVLRNGKDISYTIRAIVNNASIFINLSEDDSIISLITDSKNIELDEIMGQKKNNGLNNGLF